LTHKTREEIATICKEIFRYWFGRPDLKPLLELLPTSYHFKQGNRIRIALGGVDKDHFQKLNDPEPIWEILHTPNRASQIELPVVR
jgi:hypothetical protein